MVKKSPKAILDTSALISMYELDLMSYLNILYNQVLIPRAVEEEFINNPRIDEFEKSNRMKFLLDNLMIHSSWLKQCQEYGEDIIQLYLSDKKMDRGEAETLAQNQTLENLYEVIIDERTAKKMAKSHSMKVHGTLYLIATLDIKFQRVDYFKYTRKMMEETTTHLTQKVINLVYENVKKELL